MNCTMKNCKSQFIAARNAKGLKRRLKTKIKLGNCLNLKCKKQVRQGRELKDLAYNIGKCTLRNCKKQSLNYSKCRTKKCKCGKKS